MHGDETTRTGGHLDLDVRPLDSTALRSLYELLGRDAEALVDLADSFADEAPQALAELRRGAETGDAELIARAAHTLKSNASTFGAVELASLCRQLEVAARAGDLGGSCDVIDRIEHQWPVVREALTELRDRGRP